MLFTPFRSRLDRRAAAGDVQCGTFARMALARSTPWVLRPIRHAHTSATTLLRIAIARWHPPVAGLLFGSVGACFMEMTVGLVVSGPNFHPWGAMPEYVSVK